MANEEPLPSIKEQIDRWNRHCEHYQTLKENWRKAGLVLLEKIEDAELRAALADLLETANDLFEWHA